MAIKNKDGSTYKLSEPNPLTKNQNWDLKESGLIFHNFKWNKVVVAAENERMAPNVATENPVFTQLPEKFIPSTSVVEAPLPVIPTPVTPKKVKDVVVMHCLPAVITDRQDDLYNDSYTTLSYGEKFTFEAVIVYRGDLEFQFWTNLELSKGSVVYPSKYADGVKYGDFRWWKVNNLEPKSDGFLIEAVISSYQPDFS